MKTSKKPRISESKPLIIAELSANHNQSLEIAKDSIRAIARSGADGVKLQTYTPECLTLPSSKSYFQIKDAKLWEGRNLYNLYNEAQTPWEWHKELFSLAQSLGLLIFSSPFSPKGVEFLETLNCPIYKVASFEIAHYELLEAIAKTKKPLIISTGIATPKEIRRAIKLCHKHGAYDITLLHCVSEYPASIESANILTLQTLAKTYKKYGVKVGLSDHSLGSLCPILATSLGAVMIEKHFILDKNLGGVDSAFSLDEREFAHMVQSVRNATKALGERDFTPSKEVMKKRRVFGRSIFVTKAIKKGEKFSPENIAVIRPSHGTHPKYYKSILGKRAKCDIEAYEPLSLKDVQG